MYRKHFALTRHPFDKDLAADDLFAFTSLAELNARLKHLVDMHGIGLVTGDSGSGKTPPAGIWSRPAHGLAPRAVHVHDHRQRHGPVQVHRVGTRTADVAKPRCFVQTDTQRGLAIVRREQAAATTHHR
jgi:hypothetical protein